MLLVVDGNNLLPNMPELAWLAQPGQERAALAQALQTLRARKSGLKINLVFDGGLEPGLSRSSLHGVPVIESGAEQSADEVIIKLAKAHGPGMTVASDDRQLISQCMALGAKSLACRELAEALLAALHLPADEEDDYAAPRRKKGPSRRLPKAQRRHKPLF